MKLLFSTLFTTLSLLSFAQKTEKYYDFQWKETNSESARFYSVTLHTDSGWHRSDYFIHEKKLQMDGLYEDEANKVANGTFHYFNSNGNIQSAGQYVHGKKQGTWLSFYPDFTLADSVTYENGQVVGTRLSWHNNGYPSDSAIFMRDGSGVDISWFDNGNPSSAGRYSAGGKKTGRWQYFHKNGKVSSIELYSNDSLISRQYYDEAGNAMADTTSHDKEASFPGGLKAWSKHLYKYVFFPEQFRIVNTDQAVVVIRGTVSEDGTVTDVFVDTPFYPQFDKIALDAVRKSPKWEPAIQHNRKVKYFFRQPVYFSQQ